jgi:anti-anti-sigma factor
MTHEICPANFDCSVGEKDGCTLISLRGWLDAFAAVAFRQSVAALPDGPPVVVDLSQVKFIDSAGLGVLVSLVRRVRERGSLAAFAVPRWGVRRLLNDVGFGRIAVMTDSAEDATLMVQR